MNEPGGVKEKKQNKIVTETGNTTVTTEYAGNYIYEGNALQFFNHPEGYIEPDGSNGYNYIYQYKDHLGNIRLSYTDADGNGSINASTEIVEENNYYPFGLKHKGYNNVISPNTNSVANRFGYNSKEFQEELGLNWHDYGWRNYDAAIGRFMNPDPHADRYYMHSPYAYAFNSPVLVIDPDGRDGIVSGSGTEDDPYVVTANYYYYGLSQEQADGFNAAIAAYNNGGEAFSIKDGDGNSVHVRFNLTATDAGTEDNARDLASNDTLVIENEGGAPDTRIKFGNIVNNGAVGNPNHLGEANNYEITLDGTNTTNLANSTGANSADLIRGTSIHEIGHNLGGNHNDPGRIMVNTYSSEIQKPNCVGNCGTGRYSTSVSSVNGKGVQAIMGRAVRASDVVANRSAGYNQVTSSFLKGGQNRRISEGSVGRLVFSPEN